MSNSVSRSPLLALDVEQVDQIHNHPLKLRLCGIHGLVSVLLHTGCKQIGSGTVRKMNEAIPFILRRGVRSSSDLSDSHWQIDVVDVVQVACLAEKIKKIRFNLY